MALGKQAKILTDAQIRAVLNHVSQSRYPLRDRVMVLLSCKAGMRAKEIAALRWFMLTDIEGSLTEEIALPNTASKGKRGGRRIPINRDLAKALADLYHSLDRPGPTDPVITSERCKAGRSANSIAVWFHTVYAELGFSGASSHSGRRTFITRAARQVAAAGGSLRDVQALAGHASIDTTQRYIDVSEGACKRLVNMV